MSLHFWKDSLNRLLIRHKADTRIAIVGIGNTLRSDDAAGVLVARSLMGSRLIHDLKTVFVMDAGHAPENGTADLRRFAPDVVLLIDAADMGELPGSIRWIDMHELDGMSASTHTMPLSMLAKYLTLELNCMIALLGIQPKTTDVGESVGAEVGAAVKTVVENILDLLSHR